MVTNMDSAYILVATSSGSGYFRLVCHVHIIAPIKIQGHVQEVERAKGSRPLDRFV